MMEPAGSPRPVRIEDLERAILFLDAWARRIGRELAAAKQEQVCLPKAEAAALGAGLMTVASAVRAMIAGIIDTSHRRRRPSTRQR
jgi:hypothetical protein